jgi:7-cyano-7-deazaguanine synthase
MGDPAGDLAPRRHILSPGPTQRAVALVSGGLDSVVSMARALEELEVRLVLFMNYGQRAVERERGAVLGVVNYYNLPWREVDLEWLAELSPEGMKATAVDPALDTLDAVWVPNRNGVFLNVAAAFAERYDCGTVVTGFNRDEAAEFPDNRAEYADRVSRALELSTRNGVSVVSFTQHLGKAEIVNLGARLRAPLSVIWSCYHARELMCGRCASCARLVEALSQVDAELRPPITFETDTR